MDKIKTDNLRKAQNTFERFRQDMKTDRDQAGAVQAFEFCYELSWKLMKRVLESQGQETGSPKDTFRKAALEKLIDDPEIWFEFQKKRNLTTHTYEQEILKEIVSSFDDFSLEIQRRLERVEELMG
ncbi:MAG: nucleotidyltransferase substrate binding protein [Proteobacteria bacterium]|nr:nucleotidyltransferase substrate binding protein [Pseudomonadota bacterium]